MSHFLDGVELANAIGDRAESFDGLTYVLDPARYRETIYPHDTRVDGDYFASNGGYRGRPQSCCTLFVLACWRPFVDAPELREPYARHNGLATALVERIAVRAGALRHPGAWETEEPSRGSAVILETPGVQPSDAHGFVVLSASSGEKPGETLIASVDGGLGLGNEIRRCWRILRRDGRGILRSYDVAGSPGRPVRSWVLGELLPPLPPA